MTLGRPAGFCHKICARLARAVALVCPEVKGMLTGTNALNRITVHPTVMSGKPCIRGLRVTVANILRLLAAGHTPQRILAAYPYLEPADIDACLRYAAMRVEDEELAPVAE